MQRLHGHPLQDQAGNTTTVHGREMKTASGNWSVVNRTLNANTCPENIPFDIRLIQRRSRQAGKSLISREVLRAVQHALLADCVAIFD